MLEPWSSELGWGLGLELGLGRLDGGWDGAGARAWHSSCLEVGLRTTHKVNYLFLICRGGPLGKR